MRYYAGTKLLLGSRLFKQCSFTLATCVILKALLDLQKALSATHFSASLLRVRSHRTR